MPDPLDLRTVRNMADLAAGERTRSLLFALCDEVEALRTLSEERLALLHEVSRENTRLRALLDLRFEAGAP
jgi:hypothetical protein